jgi:hypothetical protein
MIQRKQIGVVGVDAGMVMVTDPCYLADFDSEAAHDSVVGNLNEATAQPAREEGYPYNYGGACGASCNSDQAGQLNFGAGHAGAGVVASSGYGDGTYPVFAEYNDEGRVARLTVEFLGDDDG